MADLRRGDLRALPARGLAADEARTIEGAACATPDACDTWPRPRVESASLGSSLEWIRQLRPFHRQQPETHPLRVLVERISWSKHRTPSGAAVLLGAVNQMMPLIALRGHLVPMGVEAAPLAGHAEGGRSQRVVAVAKS